ncbi:YqcC family protein [Marinobacter sp. X15-166B]|uniref:YqcC family protein n=1 Tax=Marinobacter sp. X15-166B TaxID=1897620 RepID=UPI00085C932A|nr:YqcC family protein [Marinobacter sp. X15-166B]OEY67793.1 pseudouridine synthase [Marinobacter sp. X15-166B]
MNRAQVNQVADSLLAIEMELRRLGMWSAEAPAPEALQSAQPFAIDTLTFVEWLQFVFLERMKELLEEDLPFPQVSGIAPMAEEYFRGREQLGRTLVRELKIMDELLSTAS